MGNVKEGTLYCDVFGESLMAKSCELILKVDGVEVYKRTPDLCDKAVIRLKRDIARSLQPYKPQKTKGESDGGSPETT